MKTTIDKSKPHYDSFDSGRLIWYSCECCDFDEIEMEHKYCAGCGSEIVWNGEYELEEN